MKAIQQPLDRDNYREATRMLYLGATGLVLTGCVRDEIVQFFSFTHHEAKFRLCSDCMHACVNAIREHRAQLDAYISRHPEFKTALNPIDLLPGAPEIAVRMAAAAASLDVGPMAAVAGIFAELAARAAADEGAGKAIVENGGDIYVISDEAVTVGLFAGNSSLSGKLALRIIPGEMPLAICSSSSTMGHSLSLGKCDLATAVSEDGALADAAATQAANLVHTPADITPTLNRIGAIRGIRGLLIIQGDQVGVEGDLPRIVRNLDPATAKKITQHPAARRPKVII